MNDSDVLLDSCRFYIEGVALLPISIVGIIGNALSMIVLSCPEMQNNFNHLLIGLSSFDTIYLLLSTLIFAMPKLSDNYAMYLLPHIMPIGYGFAHIGRVGSVFMTLSVTLERFFAIVYPLKRLRLKTILIAVSTFVSVVYNIPRFLEFETILQVDTNSTNNESMYQFAATGLRMNTIYIQVYVVWMKFIFVEMFPYIIIIVLNALIILRIRKAVKERQSMTVEMSAEVNEATHGQQKKDKNMAIVLICIVVMFILCQSLKIIPDIFEAFFCDHSNDTSACQSPFSLEILISVSHLMLAVNSASNFLIYMLRGDKFRQFFFQIFFKCQCTRASRRSKEANRYRNSTVHYKSSTIKNTTSAIIILEDELIERSPTTPKN